MSQNIVMTKFGAVSGVALEGRGEGVTLYKGIPYAAPPVGELRWRPPVEPAAWEGVRVCDTYGPIAIQKLDIGQESFQPYDSDFYWEGTPEASEDCLYLNVHVPDDKGDGKLPVYIWFHGGGLNHGFSYEPEFDGTALAKKGVIVVSVGQRLNVFGYLALPQLSKEQGGISGNYGFMDQMMAFKWVVQNIDAFGGDPNNITLGGQSGGSTKIALMLSQPAVRYHVKGIIAESGLKWQAHYPTLKQGEENGVNFLKAAGIDPDISLDELRKIDPWKLYAHFKSLPGTIYRDDMLFTTTSQKEMWDEVGNINFLCGCNLGEVSPRAAGPDEPITTEEDFYANYRTILGDLYDKYNFEQLVKPGEGESIWTSARRLASKGLASRGGMSFSRNLMLNRIFGMYRAKQAPDSKVFTYFWGHVLPGKPEEAGTCRDTERWLAYHSSEMWYAFASFSEGIPPVRQWTEVDYRMAETASTYWANFIKYGDPNGEGLENWPAASDNYGYMEVVQGGFEGHEGLEGDLDELLREYTLDAYGIEL